MIAAKDLRREFVSGAETVTAVDGVDLELDDGVFAAIIGPSGSGKSTLLALLGALDTPTSGTIEIGGRDVTAMSGRELTAYRRGTVGFVFQSYNLIPNLSALQNVTLPMEFAGVPAAERQERARKLLGRVGLSEDKHRRKPGRLSGGEQQRVAIARALANRPSLILADEPTGNLDRETGQLIVDLLHELARSENTTIVAVTHDLEMASLADTTFRLSDGRLVDPDVFEGAAEAANAAYERWTRSGSDGDLGRFVSAVSALIAAAPGGRRLSPSKIRRRYAKAAGRPGFEAAMDALETDDLFEEAE